MTLGIMQPYFLPYIGYWQLLGLVDQFVVYDNIQFTKKGWINRNRFLRQGTDATFTVPVKKGGEQEHVVERCVAETFDREALLNQLRENYRKAPCFEAAFPVISAIVRSEHANLFAYILHSIRATAEYLGIKTPLVVSSTVDCDHSLKGQDKVMAICEAMGATTYVNPIGGTELYSRPEFASRGIELKFIKTRPVTYPQFGAPFVASLSIVDVMMFNPVDSIRTMLREYDLV